MKRILLLMFPFFTSCSAQEGNSYLPQSIGELIHHSYFSLSYNENAEQANWICYQINNTRKMGLTERTENFRSDRLVSTKSAQLSDYKNSGFDRGHLVPAADMSFNYTAMSESFLMSNISPQAPSFNRGIWKELEGLVRNWGLKSSIYVVTGPILNSCYSNIGANNVCVPKQFYKIVYSPSEQKMISFVLPNQKGTKNLTEYVCSTDYIEKITKIDFFPVLEDKLEKKLESEIHTNIWNWETRTTNFNTKKSTLASQCKGITQKGNRCKNRTKNVKGYCHYHD